MVCALPVALALRRAGHGVHLASFTFVDIREVEGVENPLPRLYRVDDRSQPPSTGYFPEGYLSRWWRLHFGESRPVWCYHGQGVETLSDIFGYLADELSLDALVVVDAGVDGLFHGNEHSLGTPETDAVSILAAREQRRLRRYFAFTAFGTEGVGYSIRHADALERISELVAAGAMTGLGALLPNTPEGEEFRSAAEFIHSQMAPHWHSTMVSSLLAAMEGRLGEVVLTQKEGQLPTWISPLTLIYWFFLLDPVAESKPYFEQVRNTRSIHDVARAIERVREESGVVERRDIPI